MTGQRLIPAALSALLCLASAAVAGEATPPPTAADLEKAVAAMRRIDPSKMSEEQRDAKAKELNEAWQSLAKAGPAGVTRLKRELVDIDKAGEKDDFFKLGAAALLWSVGKLDEIETIVGIWSSGVDLTANCDYAFYTALHAARTQDPRVVPLLVQYLKDKEGGVFVAQHYLTVKWPLTHEFLWGAYGPKGLPTLARVLDESKDEVTLASAALLAAKAHYLPALPKVRRLAREGKGEARRMAVRALGEYGHPADFDLLVAGLKAKPGGQAKDFAWALCEYGDLRAVPHLVPLLTLPDDTLRHEVIGCLGYLLSPEALAATRRHSMSAGDEKEREWCALAVAGVLKALALDWDAYAAKSAQEQARLIASLHEKGEQECRRKPDDREFSHDDLLKAAAEWMKNHRITGGTYEWVEDRHVLAAATPADIPLLLDVKAKCYPRVSDECLIETRTLDGLVRRLGRSRYRKAVGVCEKVEAL